MEFAKQCLELNSVSWINSPSKLDSTFLKSNFLYFLCCIIVGISVGFFFSAYSSFFFFKYLFLFTYLVGFPGGSVVKNPPANVGNAGLIPRSERSYGEGNGNPF